MSTEDPSTELAPYTSMRIRQACASQNPPRLLAPLRVTSVEKDDDQYVVKATWGAPVVHEGGERREPVQSADMVAELAKLNQTEGTEFILKTPQPPLLCAGFAGSVKLGVAKDLFAWGDPAKEQGFEDLPVFDAESARKEARGMKVAELREELKAMGQPTEGTKPELIERLVASHQAEADSEDEEMEPEKKGCAEGAPLLTHPRYSHAEFPACTYSASACDASSRDPSGMKRHTSRTSATEPPSPTHCLMSRVQCVASVLTNAVDGITKLLRTNTAPNTIGSDGAP